MFLTKHMFLAILLTHSIHSLSLTPKHTPPPSINYLPYLLHPSLHVNTLFSPFSPLFFLFIYYIQYIVY